MFQLFAGTHNESIPNICREAEADTANLVLGTIVSKRPKAAAQF